MTRFVSLFRGINVGGHHGVSMTTLKELHEELGLKDVATYIQSGNVVFTSENGEPALLSAQIEEAFALKFDFRVSVVVRTSEEVDAIIACNPFQEQVKQQAKWVAVLFLAKRPESNALDDFQQSYAGPEEVRLIGQELFIYYPEGMGRSKLPGALIEKKLKTAGTSRNWNTVLRLQTMLQG